MIRISHGAIHIGHISEIHRRVVLSAIGAPNRPAKLSIGDYTSIWYGTVISAQHEITIGSHCAISWNCTIIDDDMHGLIERDGGTSTDGRDRTVRIANHVWIGASAAVLKGVTIGEDSVVAAGAIVTPAKDRRVALIRQRHAPGNAMRDGSEKHSCRCEGMCVGARARETHLGARARGLRGRETMRVADRNRA